MLFLIFIFSSCKEKNMDYTIDENVEYGTLEYSDFLEIYENRKFEEGKSGVINENNFISDNGDAPAYKKVFKRTYGDLFEVELTAFFKEEAYKNPIMGFVDVKSIEDIDIQFIPAVFTDLDLDEDNYYFSRIFVSVNKKDVNKRIKGAVEKFRFEEKDDSYILPVNLFLIDGIGK